MAAIPRKHFLSLFNSTPAGWKDAIRLYSQYAPRYQDPVFQKEELEELIKSSPLEELKASERKAPLNYQTCSPLYDPLIEKFINHVMREGKKELARTLVMSAFTHVKHNQLRLYNQEKDKEAKEKIIINPREVFHLAIENVTPLLNLRKVKKSGTWYRAPIGISKEKGISIAMKWFVEVCKNKHQRIPFEKELANELISASQETGKTFQKKVELYKLCEANRGYAHYRWG